ncbi:F0F1 ATP synthase subunit A [Alkaliphilus sp. MSJ-5]|uniref:ATP synthase subunit a n=1 Tax=Alkaliphilus flagellatus TaxID=2841507 RepID=A0ABS6G2K6_9FIRM|nr:F0F1 ATP synthase subunit A [Alkaliphilus flagellatus]MBU5676593.1 F0F1 ATP synthase subunit A [Alkaliphilus flagellatus]
MEGFGPRLINIAGLQISETVVVTWIIMAVLIILAIVTTRNFEKIPKGVQNAIEAIVDAINNLTISTMGEKNKAFAPYIGTIFMFILFANLIGLVGLRPPTADLNTTLALGIMTFIIIHFSSIKSKGIKAYIKGYFEPFFLLFPMNLLGELATPISLGFRLFGNLVGGLIIMSLLYAALAGLSGMIGLNTIPIFQAGIPVVFHLYFDLFSGALQSFIFAMLTMVFIAMAKE